jgi:hypothetical protein
MATKKVRVPKVLPEHKDKFGRVLKVGDAVVYPQHNNLIVGTVKKINNIMVGVMELGAKPGWRGLTSNTNKYPIDLVIVDGAEVTMYILKNSSK